VTRLNEALNEITRGFSSEELITLCKSITVPISKIKTIPEVIEDPLVKRRELFAKDPKSGTRITLAPPPKMTANLETNDRELTFPPRFGEQNREIYTELLGYTDEQLDGMKEKGII